MDNVLFLIGNVKFNLTLDPGVWIFDDRRIDLDTFFLPYVKPNNELDKYTMAMSKHWDREIIEGATIPPTLKTEYKYEKEKYLNGTFGIPFKPFLQNAEPKIDAKMIKIECTSSEIKIPLKDADELILGFSKNGKPLTEDGPIYIYFRDGSNRNNPIKNIKGFRIE